MIFAFGLLILKKYGAIVDNNKDNLFSTGISYGLMGAGIIGIGVSKVYLNAAPVAKWLRRLVIWHLYLLNHLTAVSSSLPWASYETSQVLHVGNRSHFFLENFLFLPHLFIDSAQIEMSLVMRKPVFGVFDLVRHKLGCTTR